MIERRVLLILVIVLECWLGFSPKADRTTWLLENLPVFLILPILFKVRMSHWALRLMALHAFVLMLGGHYTYAKVPFGFWLRDVFDFSRNPYDRIGHFFQGFVPAFVFRELLLRFSPLRRGLLLSIVALSFCLSVSALYELIEWGTAVALGEGANDFLGTQGDVWDTQMDMAFALLGAAVALVLSPWHDRALRKTFPMLASKLGSR